MGSFLRQHAHPECYKELPVLPPTIADQIKLWAIERDRFTFNEGVLYNQFLSQADFEVLKNFAQELGVLVWHNTARRTMVVTKNGHDDVKNSGRNTVKVETCKEESSRVFLSSVPFFSVVVPIVILCAYKCIHFVIN